MEEGLEGLTSEQATSLQLFQSVAADGRSNFDAVNLLRSCNWNVEQAMQLHFATLDEGTGSSAAAASQGFGGGNLGAPLLGGHQATPGPVAPTQAGGPIAQQQQQAGGQQPYTGLVGWLARGIRRIGATVLHVFSAFIFGPGGPRLTGYASGAAFQRALTSQYGANLQLPRFFEGSFSEALRRAQQDTKLLVIYLHSDMSRHTQSFCTQVLNNEFVRTMLDENFLLWGGDIARMETHQVSQMIHARQYPWFCVLLPASVDEIRVIGALDGEVQVDAAVALLAACFEEMEGHRAEIVARREQYTEDRNLRTQQDQEYQEALEMDRRRTEQREEEERQAAEAQRIVEDQRRQEKEMLDKAEAERNAVNERRKQAAAALPAESATSTARIALRLPTGQRVQRKFCSTGTLAEVYAWAECVAYLPENVGKFEVPQRFMLKLSFPSKDLTEMTSTIEELQLSGSNILLAPIDEDD